MRTFALLLLLTAAAGCAGRSGGVVVVPDDRAGPGPRRARGIPPGHYPPPGECRIWIPGRPPGQQAPPVRCDSLFGRIPRGAFILYGARDWDAEYDWQEHARRNPGAVPEIVVRLVVSMRR